MEIATNSRTRAAVARAQAAGFEMRIAHTIATVGCGGITGCARRAVRGAIAPAVGILAADQGVAVGVKAVEAGLDWPGWVLVAKVPGVAARPSVAVAAEQNNRGVMI